MMLELLEAEVAMLRRRHPEEAPEALGIQAALADDFHCADVADRRSRLYQGQPPADVCAVSVVARPGYR